MSISDAEFAHWSRADGVQRVVLCEMGCYTLNEADVAAYIALAGGEADEDGGMEIKRFLSTYLYVSGASDSPAHCCYVDRLLAAPSMRRSIDEFLDVGELVVLNPDGLYDHWITDTWEGRDIVLRIGDPSWALADFRTLLTGTVDKLLSATSDRLAFAIRDRMELLNGPVQTAMLEDGPREGQPIPLCLGKCDNISPVYLGYADVHVAAVVSLTSAAYAATIEIGTYSIGGPVPDGALVEVYGANEPAFNGVFLFTLSSGSTYTFSLNELTTATATGTLGVRVRSFVYQYHDGPTGGVRAVRDNGAAIGWTDDAANGKFTIDAAPVGAITADVYGAYKEVDDYYAWPAECIKWLVDRAGHSALVDTGNFDAFDAAHQDTISLYMPDRRNLAETLREIAAAVGAHLYFSRAGLLRIWQLTVPSDLDTPADHIRTARQYPGSFGLARIDTPTRRYRMGANRNWTPQPEDGLDGSVEPYWRQYYAREWFFIHDFGASGAAGELEPDIVDTVLYLGADEAARRAELLAAPHALYQVDLYGVLSALELGDKVRVHNGRYGFAEGHVCVVVAIDEADGQVALGLWR